MAAIAKASQAGPLTPLAVSDADPPSPPSGKQQFVLKGPMGAAHAPALQTLELRPPDDLAFYQSRHRRSGCFPLMSHGRPLLAKVASGRLREGVALPGLQLFSGFDKIYDHVQVAGLNQCLDDAGQLPNPLVWLMTHTREPDDGMLMGALHGVLPRARDGRGGHRPLPRFVMRQAGSLLEHFSTFLGMGCFSVNVATENNQSAAEQEGAPTAAQQRAAAKKAQQRAAAKRANAATLRTLQGQMARGDHPHIFVEAKIRGEGIVQLPNSCGAVVKCSRVVKPRRGVFRSRPAVDKPVPMVPVALTYEVFGRDKPVAMFSAGPTFAVNGTGPDVARELERVLARNNTLSLSGIVGAFVLDRLHPGEPGSLVTGAVRGELTLSPQRIEALLERCVSGVRAAQDPHSRLAVNEVALDVGLEDRAQRAAMAQRAFEQFQARGICDAAGVVQGDKVGPRGDVDSPLPYAEQPFNLHRDQPLRYWGNRVRQQARAMPELAGILREAYATASA